MSLEIDILRKRLRLAEMLAAQMARLSELSQDLLRGDDDMPLLMDKWTNSNRERLAITQDLNELRALEKAHGELCHY